MHACIESKLHFILLRKNRAVSSMNACHCKDPKFSYQFETIEWPISYLKHACSGVFKDFKRNLVFVELRIAVHTVLYETGHVYI